MDRHSRSQKLNLLALALGWAGFGAVACSSDSDSTPPASEAAGGTTGDTGGSSAASGGGAPASGGAGLGASSSTGGTTPVPAYCDSQTVQPLPLTISGEFVPSGWMGDSADVEMPEDGCPDRPEDAVGDCYSVIYTPAGVEGWAGVVWQHPADNWGALPGLCIADGAIKVTFWARGAEGGEVVAFGAAGASTGDLTLTDDWAPYELLLGGTRYNESGDNGGVVAGFSWSAAQDEGAPVAFNVDSIQWVAE